MPRSPDSNALALKRKLQQADSHSEPTSKRHHLQGYDPKAPWLHETKPINGWRTLGNPAVYNSLPLANMVSAVQDLIDPDFDPLTAILDDEPRFLKPLPDRIAPEDLEFLRFRGALSIPETWLRNELLRSYIQWVHSFMPVLNLQEFLRCVAENDPQGNVSVLLFQAVMFVGTAFIDIKHLQDAGYSTRKSARNAFYTRLRLLYSLDCEEDRIVILQTLLLMTYWSDPENSLHRDIWDWIGICNTQAHSIGLNKDPSASDLDPKTRRLRTRIWWCIYSRDRLIAMGMRRPLQVNEGTSNIPMLKLEDFDFEPYSPTVVALFRCRQLEDVSHQKRLATMFIEKVKLCQCIGRVLFAQYAPSQRQFGATDRTTVTLIPRQASESEFTRCSQKLDSWLSALPKDAQFIPASRSNFRDGEDVLLLHGAMLRMLYHATTSALHRPWAAHSKDQSKARLEWRNKARTKMQDAATGITHIIQGLNQLNLTRFLPQTGVTVILPAAVAHLSNSTSDNPAVRESSINNFQRCVQVLHCLKDIYPAAGHEFANLEAAIKMQASNSNTETFVQIMQYSLDSTTPPSYTVARKPSSANSIATTHSLRLLEDKPAGGARAASANTNAHGNNQNHNHDHQHNPNITSPSQHDPSQTTRRPFPNDFDDHFAVSNTPISPSAENPFTFLTFDFDSLPGMSPSPPTNTNTTTNMHTSAHQNARPKQDLNLSPTTDLDSMDWTQALFRGPDPSVVPDLDASTGTGAGADIFGIRDSEGSRRTQSLALSQPRLQQPSETENDPFAFDESDAQFRHHSAGVGTGRGHGHGDITGDLDRDLGFQTGDEEF